MARTRKIVRDELYVQLGKRRNGKIVKAENYSLEEFGEMCLYSNEIWTYVNGYETPSKFDKLFRTNKYIKYLIIKKRFEEFKRVKEEFYKGMVNLIEKDSFGKKVKK